MSKRSGSAAWTFRLRHGGRTFWYRPLGPGDPRVLQGTMNVSSRDGHKGEAASYDRYYAKRSLYWSFNVTGKVRSFVRLCRSFGVPMSDRRVLEVGFGSGGMLLKFPPSTLITGLDMSIGAVERLRHEFAVRGRRNVDLQVWAVGTQGLPAFDGKFDVVVLSHVLEHVPDDKRLLADVHSLMSPGAHLVVMVPLEDWSEIEHGHVRAFDEATIRRVVEGAGFSVKGVQTDHSIDNWFRWLALSPIVSRSPVVQDRLLGALSIVCTLLVGIERLPIFGRDRNLGLVATRL